MLARFWRGSAFVVSVLLLPFVFGGLASAQTRNAPSQQQPLAGASPDLFKSLHWRGIGPFRGGRTKSAAGVPSQPNVFYIGVVNGGVWESDEYRTTWAPVCYDQPTRSN